MMLKIKDELLSDQISGLARWYGTDTATLVEYALYQFIMEQVESAPNLMLAVPELAEYE